MSVRVAVLGATGRMGGRVAAAAGSDVALVGGIASEARDDDAAARAGYPRIVAPDDARDVIEAADVLLDVSAPAALGGILRDHAAALRGRALVTGTTGIEDGTARAVEELAQASPVVRAANFAVGVALLRAAARDLAARLAVDDWDVEIAELHHRGKADAPSGTALAFASDVADARGANLAEARTDGRSGHTGPRPPGTIGLHALRGGTAAGEHRIAFLGPHERIELVHVAEDRTLFALGALRACRWVVDRSPGLYSMDDVLAPPGAARDA
ncbi:MAG TPA: 4-hydroxy-tetrahydrodipicolinate reductase [Longimicrobiales bacterium]|nr:4-hydroxy-tetrahydrodipicolinate reductase [Longimicrobiales bacterium]